ncbi:MAG TPA: DUF488 domain-containing protein [Solirubrobacter sp.]|nr:DUF488 domain-containing protein [Solirubrobacter sp.]
MGTVLTIGHSNRELDVFIDLLQAFDVEFVGDVRTVPKSRKWPHFRAEELAQSLPAHGIEYRHLPGLGGWRRASVSSPNLGWQNESFRGYADYALTPEFADALAELKRIASEKRTAIMCSEALWWRCHRRVIADRLVTEGWEVLHIESADRAEPHRLTEFAVPQPDGRVLYPEPRS